MKIKCVILFLVSLRCFGQCPPEGVLSFSSQAEVDAFSSNYPSCTEASSLSFNGADITDLSPLSQLTTVQHLSIYNTSLTNLNGLENITITYIDFAPWIYISNNPFLTSISTLSNSSEFFVDNIEISNNPVLNSLEGLESLTESTEFFIFNNDSLINLNGLNLTVGFGTLIIRYNDGLINLEGLEENTFSQVNIESNNMLTSIEGFNSISYLENLTIIDNPNLSICNIESICSFFHNDWDSNDPYSAMVENNAENCNSINEILLSCSAIPYNDNCENAIPININEPIEAYNDFATESTNIPSCNNTDRLDVWFHFNLTIPTDIDILIDNGYNMQLWEGNCANLNQVPNTCSLNGLQDISINADTGYYLQVWSEVTGRRLSNLFNVTLQESSLSVNDFSDIYFLMYPNPLREVLNFKSDMNVDFIEVYNLIGQNVKSITPNTSLGQLDMSDLNAGLYIVKVKVNNNLATYKIIKE
ncbi:T9SS type A sorting domain-containing protein [Lacinutrix himadriensis]|uniref:T9SS type A sorting domain-containing protein n=1 Tax=Lacinutrix himadriensis TaxID=641549 RepID=UPI0006E20CB9|nr:T9SS type A sorting domain-containing protein [Lacinutrix himadriensis]